ncbi:MAG: TraR/DksA C4-type zinc finger protein [Chloroflexi bacterium]|nr:TraR/DksA C4-type zinc finger protein [Chloroflexota bacterium]
MPEYVPEILEQVRQAYSQTAGASNALVAEPPRPSADSLDACLARAAEGHSRLCPRQVLAVRMGRYAGELLGLELPRQDRRLFTFVETDGCAADGISAATGCRAGRRTLRIEDYGKVAATFVDVETGRAVRIWPHPAARQRAREWHGGAEDSWHTMLESYKVMPAELLLRSAEVTLSVSLEAIISRPGLHVPCGQCGEEIMNEREVHQGGRVLCRSCAGEGYWAARPR